MLCYMSYFFHTAPKDASLIHHMDHKPLLQPHLLRQTACLHMADEDGGELECF